MKYKVEVGAHVTRFIRRQLIIYANDESEAEEKAIDKYCKLESNVAGSVDAGYPKVDSMEVVK